MMTNRTESFLVLDTAATEHMWFRPENQKEGDKGSQQIATASSNSSFKGTYVSNTSAYIQNSDGGIARLRFERAMVSPTLRYNLLSATQLASEGWDHSLLKLELYGPDHTVYPLVIRDNLFTITLHTSQADCELINIKHHAITEPQCMQSSATPLHDFWFWVIL